MQLLLIRHSITAGNLEHRYIGCRTDEPLCEAGIALAQQKSVEFRRSFPAPELVLVSPMQRCRQTAEILFPHMPQKIVWGLQECDFGAFEGKNYQELSGDTSYQAWIDSNGTLPFPQGESREQFQRRCVEGFCELLKEVWTREKLPASLALIVHGGTIMALLDAFAEGSYYDYQCANAKGYKGRLSVEFDAAGNTLRDTIKIADVRKLEE